MLCVPPCFESVLCSTTFEPPRRTPRSRMDDLGDDQGALPCVHRPTRLGQGGGESRVCRRIELAVDGA